MAPSIHEFPTQTQAPPNLNGTGRMTFTGSEYVDEFVFRIAYALYTFREGRPGRPAESALNQLPDWKQQQYLDAAISFLTSLPPLDEFNRAFQAHVEQDTAIVLLQGVRRDASPAQWRALPLPIQKRLRGIARHALRSASTVIGGAK